MAFYHSPKIITDNLALCVDAGNSKSYPGSDNTWYDLSGNKYHAILTTTSFDGSSIVFNGTSSLCRTSLLSQELGDIFTICCIFARGTSPGSDGATSDRIISANASGGGTKWCIGINTLGSLQFAGAGGADGEPAFAVEQNIHYFFGVAYSGGSYDFYLNNELVLKDELITIGGGYSDNMSIGCRPASTDRVFDGSVSIVLAYKFRLQRNEIFQNYNALKGRFGL